MKFARRTGVSLPGRSRELADLRVRVAEAEETLRAIRDGEVDAGKEAPQVFTLQGAEHAYRVLIESMNEGALTLTAEKTILYSNRCFATMVKCPLEQVMGSSLRRFFSAENRAALRPLLKRADPSGTKIQVVLNAGDGSQLPVQISIRPLPESGSNRATISMVVTDLTEARRNEEMLRALSHRLVQAQEAERGHVALDLHDHITQLLCAIVFCSQSLADRLAAHDGPARREAIKLREMAGQAAEEVERISHDLRPSVLDQLGLVAALRETSTEFAERTGVSVELACVPLAARLPGDTEVALYRILEQALRNVETHAHAHHVTVELTLPGDFAQITIKDDGVGFCPHRRKTGRNGKKGVGLLGMRERAACLGGTLRIISTARTGTKIEVRIPMPPAASPHTVARPKSHRSGGGGRVESRLNQAAGRPPAR
ncbi:MAG TPA: ATP-binding protein [Opitutaceae bacterium]